jgi:exodeoxyribonuclease VII large subunit
VIHTYLELVEYDEARHEVAKCSGVIWASDKPILLAFEKATSSKLSSGMKILFKARPSFHPIHGLSLRIDKIDPTFTLGDMEQKLEQIRTMLREKGWWSRNQSLPRPSDYTRVAVIAPYEAAGLGDFRVEADRLHSVGLCSFDYYPAVFQGRDAGDQIVERMIEINEKCLSTSYDALVIIRGGGDKAGLYSLNHVRLATAVCRFPLPVLVGIGHERARVLIDEVACIRFATPSLAISAIRNQIVDNAYACHENWIQIRRKSSALLDGADHRCEQLANQISASAGNGLNRAGAALEAKQVGLLNNANRLLQEAEQVQIGRLKEVVNQANLHCVQMQHNIESNRSLLMREAGKQTEKADLCCDSYMSAVMSANPLSVLNRGYAYVHCQDRIVTSRRDISPGENLRITMKDGEIIATAERSSNDSH